MNKIRAVDLFAGCGGMSLGFQNAGVSIVAAYEFWDAATAVYAANFDHPVFRKDLSDPSVYSDILSHFYPDLIIGGPPCQDYSSAGKRQDANRAKLTLAYADIVCLAKPKVFVMENVPQARNSATYQSAVTQMRNSGYVIGFIVLNAARYGVPQKRKRLFCFGILNGTDAQMSELLHMVEAEASDHDMTLREYFGDSLNFEYYYRHPRNYNRRAIFSLDEPSPTVRGVNRPLPSGYKGNPNDAVEPFPGLRAMTTEERALVQTFPESFAWFGSKTNLEQMIGNAVPVKLAEHVANAVVRFFSGLN